MDLTNQRFGKLLVLGPFKKGPGRQRGFEYSWLCRCDCGVEKYIKQEYLRSGKTNSCGCLRRETMAAKQFKHGYSRTRTYRSWQRIKQRCHDSNNPAYRDYGGRGIQMCSRWRDSFENFLADMGECPGDDFSIERIDNNAGYVPNNCRWATAKGQARNTRRNRILELDGKSLCLAEWVEITGIKRTTITQRLDACGWTVEEALTTPVLRRQKHVNSS